MNTPAEWENVGQYLQDAALKILSNVNERPIYLAVAPEGWEPLTRHYFAQESSLRDQVEKAAARVAAKQPISASTLPDVRYYLILRI